MTARFSLLTPLPMGAVTPTAAFPLGSTGFRGSKQKPASDERELRIPDGIPKDAYLQLD